MRSAAEPAIGGMRTDRRQPYDRALVISWCIEDRSDDGATVGTAARQRHEQGRGRVEREKTAVRRAAQRRGAARTRRRRTKEHERGRHAAHPLQIPWLGWKDILWRTYREMQTDRLFSIAAGVTFFVLLAIFPAITALVSAYGLFFNATTITENFSLLVDILPGNVLDLMREQAGRIAANGGGALGIGVIAGIVAALWSTMSGVKAVIDALNVTYEEQESRSLIKLNLVALALTLAGFAAFLLVVGAVVVLPLVLSFVGLGGVTATLAWIVRWPALFVLLLVGLSVLYRYAPDRKRARWQWVSVGSVFATVAWIAASFVFSWFLAHFANYNATYGSLGAAVGLMMWLWISATVVLLGAELNAEIEHQTARDSTVGGEKPLGARGAVMADTVGAKQG
jgi:membrane protein